VQAKIRAEHFVHEGHISGAQARFKEAANDGFIVFS
jgi:hypothetical protein